MVFGCNSSKIPSPNYRKSDRFGSSDNITNDFEKISDLNNFDLQICQSALKIVSITILIQLDFLQSFNLKPDLIWLSETELKDFLFMNLSIPKLYFLSFSIAIKCWRVCHLHFFQFFLKNLTLQCFNEDQWEDLFVELSDRNGIKQFVCEIVLRHPKRNLKVFIENLETKVTQLLYDKKTYIMGDFNIY